MVKKFSKPRVYRSEKSHSVEIHYGDRIERFVFRQEMKASNSEEEKDNVEFSDESYYKNNGFKRLA